MKSHRRTGLIGLLLVLALFAAACGDDDDGGATATGDGASETDDGASETDSGAEDGGSDEAQAATERMEPFLEDPTELVNTTPLSAKPEEGKRIVWLQCSQPSCKVIGDEVVTAGEKLGWTVDRIDFSNTDPEAVITAMEQAVKSAPDGIALSGVPSERYETALAAAKEAGIPVVEAAVVDEVGGMEGNGIVALVGGPAAYHRAASVTGDWIIADSDAEANVLAVTADDFPIIKDEIDFLEDHIAENCESCSVRRLNQAVADIATNTPTNVVSALQQDPSIEYVYFGFGDLSRGVAPAIADAGLDVKIVGIAPTTENAQRVIDGEEDAWTSWSTPLVGWDVVDALARFFNGDDMEPVTNQPMTLRLITTDNPPSSVEPTYPENYEELYESLWQFE